MDLNNVVLIGPVYPFKGGISHYTGLLYKALSTKYKVTLISYKMQYPKVLFKKEQRDYSNKAFEINTANYWINTANPINLIHCAKKINNLKPQLIIIQWWHPYFAPCYRILCDIVHCKNILFICHNVFPHQRFIMDKLLTRWCLKKGKFFIIQSEKDREDLLSINRNAKYQLAVHPTYNAFKISNISKEKAREILNIDYTSKVLLFFGFVRPYKGLKNLLYAVSLLKTTLDDFELWIVGDFENDKIVYLELIERLGIQDYIHIVDGYVSDVEVEKYFSSCDLVVLPYESATQSGIVQIAYGFYKPVVATNVGGLPEVVINGTTGYTVDPSEPELLADAIKRFFMMGHKDEFSNNIKSQEGKYSWMKLVDAIENLVSGGLK